MLKSNFSIFPGGVYFSEIIFENLGKTMKNWEITRQFFFIFIKLFSVKFIDFSVKKSSIYPIQRNKTITNTNYF